MYLLTKLIWFNPEFILKYEFQNHSEHFFFIFLVYIYELQFLCLNITNMLPSFHRFVNSWSINLTLKLL